MRPVAVLRPEPGNAATVRRAEAIGLSIVRCPLFAISPVDWAVPSGTFDALMLTSANAVRHAGANLAKLAAFPVFAVGAATARAARQAGLNVVAEGNAGAAALLVQAEAAGVRHALALAGRERTVAPGGVVTSVVTVYAGDPIPLSLHDLAGLAGAVLLLHSGRAARRAAELLPDRANPVAALSAAVADAAGSGWPAVAIADRPTDACLLAAARRLAAD